MSYDLAPGEYFIGDVVGALGHLEGKSTQFLEDALDEGESPLNKLFHYDVNGQFMFAFVVGYEVEFVEFQAFHQGQSFKYKYSFGITGANVLPSEFAGEMPNYEDGWDPRTYGVFLRLDKPSKVTIAQDGMGYRMYVEQDEKIIFDHKI